MTKQVEHVMVTGSSGLIGQALCRALSSDGYHVIGLDRPGAPAPPPGTEAVDCDVSSEASVQAAVAKASRLAGGRLASVAHLAAFYDFSGEESPLYEEVTVHGTDRLLRHLQAVEVDQFLYTSTMLVHAPCAIGEHIDETSPIAPAWPYPESKVRAETAIRAGRGRMSAMVLRIAGVYTNHCDSIPLAHQIQRIYERRLTATVFPGDTAAGQSMVHLDDVVAACRQAVSRRRSVGPEIVLLIGERDPVSYDELQRTFAALIHGERDWETTTIPKALAKTGAWVQDKVPGVEEPFIKPWMIDLADGHYALDIRRAAAVLGWTPTRDLRRTLPSMVDALRADPAAWYASHDLGEAPKADTRPLVAFPPA